MIPGGGGGEGGEGVPLIFKWINRVSEWRDGHTLVRASVGQIWDAHRDLLTFSQNLLNPIT